MPHTPPRGLLLISVDLELDQPRLAADTQRQLAAATTRLVNLLGEFNVPATWAVSDPAHSAATEQILAGPAQHDVAILGDRGWVGREAGRKRFARELARRCAGARTAGLPVSTLVLRDAKLDGHLELAVKQGILAIRSAAGAAHAGRSTVAQPLHFGVWQFTASTQLPAQPRGWMGGFRGLAGGLRRTASRGGQYHLAIRASQLGQQGRHGGRSLENLLRCAVRLQNQGRLEVLTLAQTALRLSRPCPVSPSRSILRAA